MNKIEQAADKFIKMGYLKYVPKGEMPAIRAEMIDTLRNGYLESEWNKQCISRDRRGYPADSEELAEGRMGEFLLLMKGVFQVEGVVLDAVEDDIDDQHYDLIVNGKRHPVYDSVALANTTIWSVSTKRFLEISNILLRQAGSKERLYGVYGGNDGRVLLLTEEMHAFLRSTDLKLAANWMPYPPTAIRDDGTIAH